MATSYQDNVPTGAQSAPDNAAAPKIRTIGLSDLHDALRLGWEDFKAVPSHAIILCVIYPVLGLVLARTVLGYSVLPLLFPLIVDRRFGIRIGKMSLRANKIARLRARTSWRLDGFVASAFAR